MRARFVLAVPIVLLAVFAAANIALWASPLSDAALFWITLPLGAAYFWTVFRFYRV